VAEGQPAVAADPARRSRRIRRLAFGTLGRGLATLGATVAALAGIVTLLFQFDPRLAPCLGGRSATFTGAPFFPHYPYHQYLTDIGKSPQYIAGFSNPVGAEVRYTLVANDLRGQTLYLRETLVRIARDGTIASADTNVDDSDDLSVKAMVTPADCSLSTGGTIFINVPSGRGRFQVILEMFDGAQLTERVALGQTPVFDR
jgi:hypothetical protein